MKYSDEPLLEVRNISKEFPGVKALNNVNFKLHKGKVHALVGQNGAGKSTLIKIMSGVHKQDEGQIYLNGEIVNLTNPKKAHAMGIFTIHQELSLALHLSVSENIFLGMEKPKLSHSPFINWEKLNIEAAKVMKQLGVDIDAKTLVGELTIGQQQLVEIAKGFLTKPKILIFDEPTSALTHSEEEYLFRIIKNLKEHGIGIIYISHRLEEIFEISDSVTVLRDGNEIDTRNIEDLDYQTVTKMMIGKDLSSVDRSGFRKGKKIGKEILRVENLVAKRVNNVSFTLFEGEILGLAGLMGSGRSEIVRAIYGVNPIISGEVFIDGKLEPIDNPRTALSKGVGYTTEDRKHEGLFLDQSVKANLTVSTLKELASYGWLGKREHAASEKLVENYNIKIPSLNSEIKKLSGGNQQKVIIARILATKLKIIILDEPTKGVDVGAKQEIFNLVNKLTELGLSVIFISSEMSEVIDVSDRVLIVREGKIISEMARENVSKHKVLECILQE
jgi:ribose transport system ATP-binding protein